MKGLSQKIPILFDASSVGARNNVGDFGAQEADDFLVTDEIDGKSFVADAVQAIAAVINGFSVDDEIAVVEGFVVINIEVMVLEVVFFDVLFGEEVVGFGDEGDLDFGEAFDDVEGGEVGVGVDDDEGFLGGVENFGNFGVGVVDLAFEINLVFGLFFGHFAEGGLEGFDIAGVLLNAVVHQAFGDKLVREVFAHGDESV